MVVDYDLVRRQQIVLADLYSTDPKGTYAYTGGWNTKGLIAFALAAVFSIATVWVDALAALSGDAWLLGAFFGGAIYGVLARGAGPARAVPAKA